MNKAGMYYKNEEDITKFIVIKNQPFDDHEKSFQYASNLWETLKSQECQEEYNKKSKVKREETIRLE